MGGVGPAGHSTGASGEVYETAPDIIAEVRAAIGEAAR
jgi:hypothetical protein